MALPGRVQRLLHNQPPLLRTVTTTRPNPSPYSIQLKLRFRHTIILKPVPPLVHPANTKRLLHIRKYLADTLPGLADRSIHELAELTPAAYAAKMAK
jgi:hypothetical protein